MSHSGRGTPHGAAVPDRLDRGCALGRRYAIGVVAGSMVFADVADLVREPSYGVARQMPVGALPRIGGHANRSAVIEILVGLLSDDDVVLPAISAVRRIRATDARPALEHLQNHEQDTIRRHARDALDRLP